MNVWIINHYAIPPSLGGLNRHYYFSKYMGQDGHNVRIFTSSRIHNSDVNMIQGNELYSEQFVDGIEYTFVSGSPYKGNGLSRIINMLEFPLKIWKVCRRFEKPDVIYTSSPSIFTAFSALLMAKKHKLPCVVEVRDLWPESIVEYQGLSRKNPIIVLLYQLERWIYKKADRLIFTMEGGADYIREKGWDSEIDMSKIHHINNGVDLHEFDDNFNKYRINDADLLSEKFKVGYAGSMRKVNDIPVLLEVAKLVQDAVGDKISFIFYGTGDNMSELNEYIKNNNIKNVLLKGFVEKKYIPFILKNSNISLVHFKQTNLMRFGCSLNKLFDYLAAGKPILQTVDIAHGLVKMYNCGRVVNQTPADIAEAVLEMAELSSEDAEQMGENAREVAKEYDFVRLTKKVEAVLETIKKEYENK